MEVDARYPGKPNIKHKALGTRCSTAREKRFCRAEDLGDESSASKTRRTALRIPSSSSTIAAALTGDADTTVRPARLQFSMQCTAPFEEAMIRASWGAAIRP